VTSSDTPRGSAALLAGAVLAGFDAGAVGFVLPAMRAATGVDPQAGSALVWVYVLGTLLSIAGSGAAVARWGAARLWTASLLLAAAGALLAALATGLLALTAAPLLSLAATRVAQQWPAGRQGRLIGALSLAYGVAFLGATLSTPLLLQFGWRSGFVLSAVVAALALAASVRLPAARVTAPAPHAATPWRLLRQGEMRAIAVLSLGTGVGQAVLVWLPTLAQLRLAATPLATAGLMLPLVLGGLASTAAVTLWLDRVGARRAIAAGAALTLVGALVVAALPPSAWAYAVGAGVFGVGITALCGGPLRYAAARALPAAAQGLAQSAVALLTNVGLLGGSLLLGHVSAALPTEAQGVQAAVLAACVLMTASFVAVAGVARHRLADTGAAAPR
jgi:MFS family permease